jgi:polyhydroxyalkanoate synthesis regulator phasin
MNEETVEVDMQAILIQAVQELNLKVEALKARVEQLENKQ